jgi:hypothetical protein
MMHGALLLLLLQKQKAKKLGKVLEVPKVTIWGVMKGWCIGKSKRGAWRVFSLRIFV